MKNLGLGDLSVLAYGLNLAGYWPPCFNPNLMILDLLDKIFYTGKLNRMHMA